MYMSTITYDVQVCGISSYHNHTNQLNVQKNPLWLMFCFCPTYNKHQTTTHIRHGQRNTTTTVDWQRSQAKHTKIETCLQL